VLGFGSWVLGSVFGALGLGSRDQTSGFRVPDSGVKGLGVRVWGSGFRVQGSGFRI